jgi:hypothetical protein
MNYQRWIVLLLGGVVLLPIAILVSLGAAWLLSSFGDEDGGTWMIRLTVVEGIVWVLSGVGLVVLQALLALGFCEPECEHDHSEVAP